MATCTIIIENETNVKFEGLDLVARKSLSKAVEYFLPHARYSPAYKLGRWSGTTTFCSLGGRTYLNLLDKLLPILQERGYELEIRDERKDHTFEFTPIDENYLSHMVWPPGHRAAGEPIVIRDYQVQAINECLQNPQGISVAPTSAGKCQPYSSKIKIPNGWKTMKDIAVGDQITTPTGSTATVISLYEPGIKDVYEITFEDGRTARSCADHIWKVGSHTWEDSNSWKLLTLREIIDNQTRLAMSVPLATMVNDNVTVDLPINPYVLGTLISNVLAKRSIDSVQTGNTSPVFSTYYFYQVAIQNLGLIDTHSYDTFVPNLYLNADYSRRLEMIQGLLDTAGYIGDNGKVCFATNSEMLAHNMCYLIQSIGGIAVFTCDETNNIYTVTVYHPTPNILITSAGNLTIDSIIAAYCVPMLAIVNIQKVSSEPVRCIMINDADHLYVTDSFVVTHNTIITASLSKLAEQYGRTIVIVPNKNLVQQTEEDYRNIGLDVGVLYGDRKEYTKQHTICTWQSLNVLDKKSKDAFDDEQLKEFLNNLIAIICDECHSVKNANILHTLLTTTFSNIPIRWGLTGTIPEEEYNQISLVSAIGPIIGSLTAKELQDAGYLAQCHVTIKQTQETATYNSYQEELKYLVTNTTRLSWLAGEISNIAKNGNTLILIDRIETGEILHSMLPDSTFISGKMKSTNRKDAYKEINLADNAIMIATYGTTSTGINIARIFNLILVEPGKSFVRVIQSIGRGLRMADDKDRVNIIDVTSKCKFSNRHLIKRKKFYNDVKYPFTVEKVKY